MFKHEQSWKSGRDFIITVIWEHNTQQRLLITSDSFSSQIRSYFLELSGKCIRILFCFNFGTSNSTLNKLLVSADTAVCMRVFVYGWERRYFWTPILATWNGSHGSYHSLAWSFEPVCPFIQLSSGPPDKQDYRSTWKDIKVWYSALQGQQQQKE